MLKYEALTENTAYRMEQDKRMGTCPSLAFDEDGVIHGLF